MVIACALDFGQETNYPTGILLLRLGESHISILKEATAIAFYIL
jgi:hypothetical protein